MPNLDRYNVVWTSESKDSSESMPVGGHDIGMNAWVEKGDILLYVQRSGCFDENNEYLKLGRLRLALDPNPFESSTGFKQELVLRAGSVEITGGGTTVSIWADVFRPVVHLDIVSDRAISAEISYEGWRNEDQDLPDGDKRSRFGCFSWDRYPGKVTRYHDSVTHREDAVYFYHRNRDDKLLFDYMVRQQGLEAKKEQLLNTQKGRTFGGLLTGDGFKAAGTRDGVYADTPFRAWVLRSVEPRTAHTIKLYTHVDQTESLDEWTTVLDAFAQSDNGEHARRETVAWWESFWNRSWLLINPDNTDPDSEIWQISRNYQLFRYQLGCNAFGSYPTKFNGGNFTFDPGLVQPDRSGVPDWRAWGGGSFTAQNQRLLYWPMLKSGDFDAMVPQFDFYNRALPNATARVEEYWGHEGCLFTEQMENFGLPIACAWGWTEAGAQARVRPPDFEHGVQVNPACIYHYESQLEFSYMILEYHRFTGDDISPYMDFIRRSVRFFDEHYQMRNSTATGRPLDDNGKLVIYPSTSCESYKGAKNPSDLIAGLSACVESILALPVQFLDEQEREYFRRLLGRIPDYGYGEVEGDTILQPAWSWERYQNCECPQFYPLFPFNRFGPDNMELFKNTWDHGTFPKDMVQSWHQDGIFFARMGETQRAADYIIKKMRDSERRFPTFWGPGHDWVPDHNWGGSGMIGMQEMLLQTRGDSLLLFPAWPRDWDVDFKLHAPKGSVVEGRLQDGSLIELSVFPEERLLNLMVSPAIEISASVKLLLNDAKSG